MSTRTRLRAVTTTALARCKAEGKPIGMLTAYDACFARLADQAGADMILVGDSLGMVFAGHSTTLPVTLEQMIYHTQAVCRGTRHAMVVADMPFMSYQSSTADALRNAGRLLAEGGAAAVKLEGGQHLAPTIHALVQAGIPVMGHIGLTPQSVHAMGGYRVQGRTPDDAQRLLQDACAIQDAGAFAIVLEGIPAALAARLTGQLMIPSIGIGAGPNCDGQVLVMHDLLGLNQDFVPSFVRQYAQLGDQVRQSFEHYLDEVRNRQFPTAEHSYEA